MAFTLTIETGNAAFGEDEYERDVEIARILRTLAERFDDGVADLTQGAVRDVNGNRVGEWNYANPE